MLQEDTISVTCHDHHRTGSTGESVVIFSAMYSSHHWMTRAHWLSFSRRTPLMISITANAMSVENISFFMVIEKLKYLYNLS
jgi:hypothetical protein